MEEKPSEIINQIIQRLVYHSCSRHEDIAGFQLVSDEKYPVILSSKTMSPPSKLVRPNAEFLSFNKLSVRLKEAYAREQESFSLESEAIEKCKESFENLKKSVLIILENVQKKLFVWLSPKKKTISFINRFSDGDLNEDSAFISGLDELLRFFGSEPCDLKVKRTVERINSFAQEVMEIMERVAVKYEDIQKPINHLPSTIVDPKEGFDFFSNVLSPDVSSKKFELLFRGSRDGFSACQFHSKCDNQGPTLTIVRTATNHVFGGFAMVPWEPGKDQQDEKAFLFSWNHKEIYYQSQNFHAAVRNDLNYGPFFGFGPQFRLTDNCNKNNSSIMKVDNEPTFSLGRDRDSVTGSFNFTVSDYEVFLVKNY